MFPVLSPESAALTNSWRDLDDLIRSWWDCDVHRATEEDVRNDPDQTLLFLPHPYTTPGGSEKAFPEVYGWDTYYINCALFAHDRMDLALNNILNQLFQSDHYGMTLNGNRTWYQTRSHPPLWAEGIRRAYEHGEGIGLVRKAYPILVNEYTGYWNAPHHQTPTGLATNRDIGETDSPTLHAESETGLDFFAGFGGEVRHCNPLITNCILVNFTRNLAWMARELGLAAEAIGWDAESDRRADLIRELCWDPQEEFFFEYNFVDRRRIPVRSLNAYWTLWARIATEGQAAALVRHLERFTQPGGLPMTDRHYPSPHSEFEWLQWGYPAGWSPFQIMVTEALDHYVYVNESKRVAKTFLQMQLDLYRSTGKLWEKYNVVNRSLDFPHERYEVPPLHGWSSASVVLLGRRLGL